MSPARVELLRGGLVESVHRVHVVVADAAGRVLAHAGDDGFPTFLRSAAKPFQALPLVEDGVVDALGLTPEELALCCASHNSEPAHVDTARRILGRAGLDEGALACGGHPPIRREEGLRIARAGRSPGAIDSNCSGKHAGMLALAVHHAWPVDGYHRADHPVQRRMLEEMVRWTRLPRDEIGIGIDGCGVSAFRVPLSRAATAWAGFGASAARGEGPARITGAMAAHPWMVAGTGRVCTELMEATGGRVLAKTGAEGVQAAAVPVEGVGMTVKVEGGGRKAAELALVRTLELLDLLTGEETEALTRHRDPPIRNTRGEEVGRLRTRVELTGGSR